MFILLKINFYVKKTEGYVPVGDLNATNLLL